jgi:predicted nuclease of restriction endonuclease-like (RecB) superfamily
MKPMEEMNHSFSLQYLGIQQKIQQETREFNLPSNIMKSRHEAAKNAINNIR